MIKKQALRTALLLLLIVLMVLGTACGAAWADAGPFRTEDRPMERAGQRIYGKLYLPETAGEEPLPLVIVEGAGHGFTGEDLEQTARRAVAFIQQILTRRDLQKAP